MGDGSDLARLSKQFVEDPCVVKEGGDYYLESSRLDSCEAYREVLKVARQQLKTIRAASLEIDFEQPLEPGSVIEEHPDGTRHAYVRGTVKARSYATGKVKTKSEQDGSFGSGPKDYEPSEEELFFELPRQDQVAEELVDLIGEGNDWVNLYRIWEFIRDKAEARPSDKGWISKSDERLFKRTANSRDAIGNEARHADATGGRPENPMTHDKAKQIVKSVVRDFLKQRYNQLD